MKVPLKMAKAKWKFWKIKTMQFCLYYHSHFLDISRYFFQVAAGGRCQRKAKSKDIPSAMASPVHSLGLSERQREERWRFNHYKFPEKTHRKMVVNHRKTHRNHGDLTTFLMVMEKWWFLWFKNGLTMVNNGMIWDLASGKHLHRWNITII